MLNCGICSTIGYRTFEAVGSDVIPVVHAQGNSKNKNMDKRWGVFFRGCCLVTFRGYA